jgi:hypothetical protein
MIRHLLAVIAFVIAASPAVAHDPNYELPWPLSAHPNPAWGLPENPGTHWMYTNSIYTWDYGSGAEPYRTNLWGPYTTIVTNGQQWTWPQSAGAVIQIHGSNTYSFDNGASGTMRLGGNGTAALPIFFVGCGANQSTNEADLPVLNRNNGLYFLGTWCGAYQFRVTNQTSGVRFIGSTSGWGTAITNCFIRDWYFRGQGTSSGSSHCVTTTGSSASMWNQNLLVYSCFGTRFGNYTNATENDSSFTLSGQFTTNIWYIANDTARFGGDSFRCGTNSEGVFVLETTTKGYIFADNVGWQNGENLHDTKEADSVIFVRNRGHEHGFITSGGGQAISTHYYGRHLYYLNNQIWDNGGAGHGFYFNGQTNEVWLVGNLAYSQTGRASYPDRGRGNFHFHNNTFVEFGNGIICSTTAAGSLVGSLVGSGNIVVDITSGIYLQVESSTVRATTSWKYNNFFSTTGGAVNIDWGATSAFGTWQAANPSQTGNVSVDPLFVNAAGGDYRIVEASPMRGLNVDDWQTTFRTEFQATWGYDPGEPVDYYGNPFNDDAGAFAYDSGATPPPAAPTGVNAVANAHDDVDVTWGNVTGEDEFRVYVSTTPSNEDPTLVTTTAANTLTATFDTLSEFTPQGGTTYYFTIRACSDAGGCSALSAEGSVTTPVFIPIATTGQGRAQNGSRLSKIGR